MNPNKLDDPEIIDKVFTPSFNLLELEARILQHGSLETLASRISKCIRCGKCKTDCCVFFPGGDIYFHPRNKNLAIGSLIEALLYDMQRSHYPRFISFGNLERDCRPLHPVRQVPQTLSRGHRHGQRIHS
jgi:L-lactate utilization protein LutB